jgi:hypothetical protein
VALAKLPGMKEGPAVLRVIARDASLWHFFSGNEAVLEKNSRSISHRPRWSSLPTTGT